VYLTKDKTSTTRELKGKLEFSKLNIFVAYQRIHMPQGIKVSLVAIVTLPFERN
jgi:hypothetical protein